MVWEAYKKVKANKGTYGVDGQSLTDFEKKLKDNLYKIWNRMSSGSYFPPAVKGVDIPKENGCFRRLGIPTVGDRIAQMAAKMELEVEVEAEFHEDSYGYRPGKSAHDALQKTRARCWQYDWVIDLDIRGFFDNIDHELLLRAVRRHTRKRWVLLYIERWLKAPMELADGTIKERDKGTPQGGVISPLLANIFLHYVFDKWMEMNYPDIPFERYADDVVVHCVSEKQSLYIKDMIDKRLKSCHLGLHPEKTKIVYCKDSNRQGQYKNEQFDFLGYTFRARKVKAKTGKYFVSFTPAISSKSRKGIGEKIREWKLSKWSSQTIEEMAKRLNPEIRGWINYYGKFCPSALFPIYRQLFYHQTKWASWKYKMRSYSKARKWMRRIAKREPELFAYWPNWYRTYGGITGAV